MCQLECRCRRNIHFTFHQVSLRTSSMMFRYNSSPSLPVTFFLSTVAVGFSRQEPHCLMQSFNFIFRSGNSSDSFLKTFPFPLLFSQNLIFTDHPVLYRKRGSDRRNEDPLPHLSVYHQYALAVVTNQFEFCYQITVVVLFLNLFSYKPM